MKALVLTKYNQLDYIDVEQPETGPDDVLIEVKACGICGSDLHGVDGSSGRRLPPIIMGHEASGIVAEVGANVTEWEVGNRVTFDSTVYCGTCHFCRRGEVNLCDHRQVLGVSCEEFRRDGAMAEYLVVPQHIVYRMPEKLSFEHAAMVEPVSIALHAARRLPLSPNDTVVVVGAGMIGLLCVQVVRALGCGMVFAVDIDPRRLELAKQLGADDAFSPNDTDVATEVMQRTGGRGADVAMEAVGIDSTVSMAVDVVRKGGALALVGNIAAHVDLSLQAVVTRELSLFGSCASRAEYDICLDMIARGAIRLDALTGAVAPLAEGAEWFRRLHDGKDGLMKVVLRP